VTEAKPDIAEMPFEAALAELEDIVDHLEKGSVALDESIKLYERGEALKKRCDELLKNAEMRIEKITLSADGAIRGRVSGDGQGHEHRTSAVGGCLPSRWSVSQLNDLRRIMTKRCTRRISKLRVNHFPFD
jgi:exodeoxyribonuclease VII small subunit